jgi:hypothetical protein
MAHHRILLRDRQQAVDTLRIVSDAPTTENLGFFDKF